MTEQWKDVVGLEGKYEVSDNGRIRSHLTAKGKPPRMLKLNVGKNGYQRVGLSYPGQPPKLYYVHQLVLEAFKGSRPKGCVSRHLNDNRLDNRACNLAWGTPCDNLSDARRNGKLRLEEQAPQAKLSRHEARMVWRYYYWGNLGQRTCAELFALSPGTIQRLIERGTWQSATEGLTAYPHKRHCTAPPERVTQIKPVRRGCLVDGVVNTAKNPHA